MKSKILLSAILGACMLSCSTDSVDLSKENGKSQKISNIPGKVYDLQKELEGIIQSPEWISKTNAIKDFNDLISTTQPFNLNL